MEKEEFKKAEVIAFNGSEGAYKNYIVFVVLSLFPVFAVEFTNS